MCGGAAQPKGSLGRDRLDIGDAADAVSPEDSFRLRHADNGNARRRFVNGKLLSIVIPTSGSQNAELISARLFT